MCLFSYISSFGKYKYARKFEENNSKSFHAKSTQYLPKTFAVRVTGNMNPLSTDLAKFGTKRIIFLSVPKFGTELAPLCEWLCRSVGQWQSGRWQSI